MLAAALFTVKLAVAGVGAAKFVVEACVAFKLTVPAPVSVTIPVELLMLAGPLVTE
jgi:hypothetical protein